MTKVIVSLSTIPPRFRTLAPTLASILAQTCRPDAIYLQIPHAYRRFPTWDGQLPEVPDGITICRPTTDYGPATKILPTVLAHRDEDVLIFFCDDDRCYDPTLLTAMVQVAERRPDCVITNQGMQAYMVGPTRGIGRRWPQAHRFWRIADIGFHIRYLARQIQMGRRWRDAHEPERLAFKWSGYCDILEGFGGVLVRPAFFDDAMFDIPPVLWSVDDFWLSGSFARQKIGIWMRGRTLEPPLTHAHDAEPLYRAVIDGTDRKDANLTALKYFQDTHRVWL